MSQDALPLDLFVPGSAAAHNPEGSLLLDALAIAVPLEVAEMAQLDPQERINRARELWAQFQPRSAKQEDAEMARFTGGAALTYGGKGAAGEFAILAKVLAAMALQPGGVTAFGAHWCVEHELCEAAVVEARRRLCLG